MTETYATEGDTQFAAPPTEEIRTRFIQRHSKMYSERKAGPIKSHKNEDYFHLYPGTTITIKFKNENPMSRSIITELTGTAEDIRDSKPLLERLIGYSLRRKDNK